MYQSQFSPHAMVHLLGSYQANGQFLPLQNHGYYGNNQAGSHKEFNHFNRHSNYNRQRVTQQGSYSHDYSQRYNNGHEVHSSNSGLYNAGHGAGGGLSIDWPHRFHSPSNHSNHHQHHGTPQRLGHPSALPVTPVGSRPHNYRSMDQGKRGPWNKLGKRHQTYHAQQQQQQPPQQQQQRQQSQQQDNASCGNSDSGFSSRSPTPTPNKHYKEAGQAESSDDRESLHSSVSEPKNKQNKNIKSGNGRGNLVSSLSTSNLYHNHRQLNENAIQNQQNRRKYPALRNSPNSQRQRNKKFNGAILPEIPIFQKFFYSPADRFLEKAYLLQYKKPTNVATGSIYDKLSKAIWDKFEQNQLSHEKFIHKMYLWRHLFFFIKSRFPQFGLYMVGSTLNGFGTNGSDVDMCLFVRDVAIDQRGEAIYRLSQIMSCLRRNEYISHLELIQARVPILKIHDGFYNLDVDLNYNNVVGIRNTHLMYCYSRIDWRVRPLVLVVKMWAQCQNINNARDMTLSSYSLVLMVIHFLQSGIKPPVLPCLHNLFKDKFHPMSDIHCIDIHEELNIPIDALQPKNTQTLGELLIEFFKYYDLFDFDQYAISVRVAAKIPIETCRYVRTPKNDVHQWKCMCIEEPFDFTNTARSVYDPAAFQMIKDVFRQTYERLKKTNNLSVIFTRLENNNNSNSKDVNNSNNL